MTRITAHDVAALAKLNAAIQRHNEAHPGASVDALLHGPHDGWQVDIVSGYDEADIIAGAHYITLGDAINAAMAAWKEARG